MVMSKRPRVPAALHSELSEYSSLLRALRTSNTLDLASQLTAPPPPTLVSSHDADDEADDGASERFVTESVTSSVAGSQTSSSKMKAKAASKAKAKKDYWTRWPLLAGDVHVPEWTLEDEIKLLALHALRNDPLLSNLPEHQQELGCEGGESPASTSHADIKSFDQESSTIFDDELEESIDPEQVLTPQFLAGLTSSAGLYLSRILALLAAYVPPIEKSMQNRVHPIGWQSVLDIAAVNGLADQETIERVKKRLMSLYTSVSVGQSHTFSDDEPLRRACAAYDGSYLSIDGYIPESVQLKRKRGPYRKRKARSTAEPEYGNDRPGPSKRQKSTGS